MKSFFRDPARCVLAFLSAVYLFFFTSPLTLGNVIAEKDLKSTPLNETFRLSDDIEITLTGWRYCPGKALMEVELSVLNMRSDLNRELSFSASVRNNPSSGGRKLSCEMILSESRTTVLWIFTDGKDFSEVSLRIKDPDGNVLSLYASKESMTEVSDIEKMDLSGYLLRRYEGMLEELEKEKEELTELLDSKRQESANLELLTEELYSDTSVATAEDLSERDKLTVKNEDRIRSLEEEAEELEQELASVSEKEKELIKRINELKEEGNEKED